MPERYDFGSYAQFPSNIGDMGVTTRDAILGGKLHLVQPAHGMGYRMNQDAILLADFAHEGRYAEFALDLGAGTGGVGLVLLTRGTAKQVIFVEVDPMLAMLARENLEGNGFGVTSMRAPEPLATGPQERAGGRVATADVATFECVENVELIVCNPPFFPGKSGRPSQHEGLNQARIGDVSAFIRCARKNLAPRGRVCFIYPVLYLESLLAGFRTNGLIAKRMRFVHPKRDANARVALVEAVVGKPNGLQVQAPWFDDSYQFVEPAPPSRGAR